MFPTATLSAGRNIAVVGEALVDIVVAPDGSRSERVGGRPALVARGLGRLGTPTTLVTTFGDDRRGRAIDNELTGSGVTVVQAGSSPTRTSPTRTSPTRTSPPRTSTITTHAGYSDAEIADLTCRVDITDVPAVEHVHVGSLSVVRGSGATDLARVVDGLDPDTTVSYDVALRPALMGPRETAVDLICTMMSRSSIVKLSEDDLHWLRPDDRRGEAIRWLMARGPAILVVTNSTYAVTGYARSGSVVVRGNGVDGADLADWEDAVMAGLLHAMDDRNLLGRRSDAERLRSIGVDRLHGILYRATVCAAPAITSVDFRYSRNLVPAVSG